jgi:hypothetical protein
LADHVVENVSQPLLKFARKPQLNKRINRATQPVKTTDESIKNRPKTKQTNKQTNADAEIHNPAETSEPKAIVALHGLRTTHARHSVQTDRGR